MSNNKNTALVLVVAALVAWGTVKLSLPEQFKTASKKETTFERVMRTKTLRCGWFNYNPATFKDPNTGEMHGIVVDALENVGKQLDIKIDWSNETTLASFVEDVRTRKYDMFCSPAWLLSPGELVSGEFTSPLYFSQIGAWVHEGNTKLDNNLVAINSPDVTITGIDGSYAQLLAAAKFPKAKNLSAPSSAEYTTGIMNVAFGKADVTFMENFSAMEFSAKNPGKVRQLPLPVALDTRPNVMMIAKGEFELQSMLNYALMNVQLTGAMDEILDKYETHPGAFKRVKY